MKRRHLLTLLVATIAAGRSSAQAQEAPILIGFLSSGSSEAYRDFVAAFRNGLETLGYSAGRNVVIESRWADGHSANLPALAGDLVARNVRVVAATGISSALAAKAASATIPMVFLSGDDPVRFGLVSSFSRPGGNATGVNLLTSTVLAKRLDLAQALAPVGHLALLANPSSPEAPSQIADFEAAAQAASRPVSILSAQNNGELATAYKRASEARVAALIISNDPLFNSHRERLVALAKEHRILALYDRREYAVAGGLISYGVDYRAAYREMGIYAGRILRGAAPSDLPVQQPTKLELVINAKAAHAFGLVIPPAVLALADEVIE